MQNPDAIKPILRQSGIPPQSHCNCSTIVPEYIELELHVGTLVDELRQNCIIIQDYTAIGAEQTRSRVPISEQPLEIL